MASTLRIAVLGNCQAIVVAECIRFLVPSAEVDLYVVWEVRNMTANTPDFLNRLRQYSFVLSTPRFDPGMDGFNMEILKSAVPQLILYPYIAFAGFHPDLIYLIPPAGVGNHSHYVKSPIGHYHSALAYFCFSLGLTEEATVASFNQEVFDKLGYFSPLLWRLSEQDLLESGRSANFPLERYYRSWLRRGCFMHSVNHPKLSVLADIAAGALAKCGVAVEGRTCTDYLQDLHLNSAVWPIYPEIAQRFGLAGSYVFKAIDGPHGKGPYYDLREFVSRSFSCYRENSVDRIFCYRAWRDHRADVWNADQAVLDAILGKRKPEPPVSPDSCASSEDCPR